MNYTKREFFNEWLRAVNAHGGFVEWKKVMSMNPRYVEESIEDIDSDMSGLVDLYETESHSIAELNKLLSRFGGDSTTDAPPPENNMFPQNDKKKKPKRK